MFFMGWKIYGTWAESSQKNLVRGKLKTNFLSVIDKICQNFDKVCDFGNIMSNLTL